MRRLVVLLALLGLGGVARADDGLRCGEWLVSTGASQAEVAAKCGTPTRVDTRRAVLRIRGATMRCTIDHWTYDRGPSDFVRTLEFHDGVLADVGVGDHGS
ncbi:MAG TPA: DUF2845 domain-containing protein [Polyangia bacterium]|jgi:hypothetical protein